jgi:hypothetical protein
MSEEQSSTGSEESAAPVTPSTDGRAQMSEERYSSQEEDAAARQQQQQQKPPAHAPASGTKYVLNPKTGLYDIHRVDDEGNEHVQNGEDDLPEDLKRELAGKQDDAPSSIELPDILPDYLRDNPETQALVAEGAAAMKQGGEYGDVEVQRFVDLVAQFEVEIGTDQPNLYEEERIRGMLRARWGSAYDGRLEKVNAYVNALPALRAYLNRTGAGNQLSVLEALGMVTCGDMAHKPEAAAKIMAALRSDPKSALRDPYHKNHRLMVQQAKVWADIIDRGEKSAGRKADVKELVQDRQDAEAKAKGKPVVDDAMAKLDAEAAEIRRQPDYFQPGKSPDLHRSLKARMAEIMRQRWPS